MQKLLPFFLFLLSLSVWSSELLYLTPESVDLHNFPPPPALHSEADEMDLAQVLEIQNQRNQADCHRAHTEDTGLATSFFAPPYGPLSLETAEKLVVFQEKLFDEINYFSRALKRKWKRERPFLRDARIRPCIPFISSASYPSGHATIAYVATQTFSLLFPHLRAEFEKRNLTIAYDRVVGGVHYPSDIVAGQELGRRIFEELLKSEAFQKDLQLHVP